MQVTAGPCEAAVSTAVSRRHQARPVAAGNQAVQLPPKAVVIGKGKASKPSSKPVEDMQGREPATAPAKQLPGVTGVPEMAAKQVCNSPVQALPMCWVVAAWGLAVQFRSLFLVVDAPVLEVLPCQATAAICLGD